MKTLFMIFAAVLTGGSVLQAQTPPTPPTPAQMAQREVNRYAGMLALSAAQVTTAEALFTAEATSAEPLRTQERTAHQVLDAAIEGGDTATIQQAATTIGQLQGESTSLRALTQAKFYQTLTADQKTKFADLPKGPGGPGGPGMPPPDGQ